MKNEKKIIADESIVVDENGQPIFHMQLACEFCNRPIKANDDYTVDTPKGKRYVCVFCFEKLNDPALCHCLRCHNFWYKRTPVPGQCPKCGSAKWQIPRSESVLGRKPKSEV